MKPNRIAILAIMNLALAVMLLVAGIFTYNSIDRLCGIAEYDLYDITDYSYIIPTEAEGLMVTYYRSYGGDLEIRDGATAIGSGVFNGVRLSSQSNPQIIDSIYLSDSVKVIERKAFFGTQAKWVRLPSDVTYIGDLAFAEAYSLERVYFDEVPDHHIEISPTAFAYLEGVEFVNFPDYIVFGEDNLIRYK